MSPSEWRSQALSRLNETRRRIDYASTNDERVRLSGVLAGIRRALRVTDGLTTWAEVLYALSKATREATTMRSGLKIATSLAVMAAAKNEGKTELVAPMEGSEEPKKRPYPQRKHNIVGMQVGPGFTVVRQCGERHHVVRCEKGHEFTRASITIRNTINGHSPRIRCDHCPVEKPRQRAR